MIMMKYDLDTVPSVFTEINNPSSDLDVEGSLISWDTAVVVVSSLRLETLRVRLGRWAVQIIQVNRMCMWLLTDQGF